MAKPPVVDVRFESAVIPTYEPSWPDPNPMFLENRVYQGSSGRVYPLPFTDRIAEKPSKRSWQTVIIENRFLRVTILPALGGRIHRLEDKTNGFDLIYAQSVIKPALVGLAGPWISGGIEFNWPQHHRPSTFLPADTAIERHPDGSATVWQSEHDPMARMKGMHGIRLHPDLARVELVVRAYNRTADVQTFLWWANIAVRVHEEYQSVFPPDVTHVADHAKRATSSFPFCTGSYYGVDYAARARRPPPVEEVPRLYPPRRTAGGPGDAEPTYPANDLSWYANIPVPTSYMAMGSKADFVGGYDHRAKAGLIHVANHHLSPGKKQWTWGNQEFGYAWDRNLTDPNPAGEYPPYVELMAGVFTDNQPDFSFLHPGETKTWSQFWYPVQDIGPVRAANERIAVAVTLTEGLACIGIVSTEFQPDARARLEHQGAVVGEWRQNLLPGRAFRFQAAVDRKANPDDFTLRIQTDQGVELIAHSLKAPPAAEVPAAARPPAAPAAIATADELYVIGLHLEQYRHATTHPEAYWAEALRRDPFDARCNLALGRFHLRRGEFDRAESHLRRSLERLLSRNPNPYDGEAHYQLGVCLRHRAFDRHVDPELLAEAYAAFYKATWNHAWYAAGHHALAEIDALRSRWPESLGHLDCVLQVEPDNLRARNLKVTGLKLVGRREEADRLLEATLGLDPLDWWARFLSGQPMGCDLQVKLDLAFDCARAGLWSDALAMLEIAPEGPRTPAPSAAPAPRLPDASLGAKPMVAYTRAWLHHLLGEQEEARNELLAAVRIAPDHCFPSRLEEQSVLRYAIGARPRDARAPYYLANFLYDRKRYAEAIKLWERAVQGDPGNATAWRNLGIAYYNVNRDVRAARRAYDRATRARPGDARLAYEKDQLWKRVGESPARRRRQLRRLARLVATRDDLTIELCALHNQLGAPAAAARLLAARNFQPWEGGEGQVLGQHVRTCLALGRAALGRRNPKKALRYFLAALHPPPNLGEQRHPLANQSDVHYWLGVAQAKAGNGAEARSHWAAAAQAVGDFQAMSVHPYSEMTYYSALSLLQLGHGGAAKRLLRRLLHYARKLGKTEARIDYFATSLPSMLLFNDDLNRRQQVKAWFMQAQALQGLGTSKLAVGRLLDRVLGEDPNHALAADFKSALRSRP